MTLEVQRQRARDRNYRVGIIYALAVTAGVQVRVQFPDRDQMVSYWLDTPNYYKPELGDAVICTMDENDEAGAVIGAVRPGKFSCWPEDGAQFYYDRVAHKLSMLFPDAASIYYDATAHAFSIALPNGATAAIAANGASYQIDALGNVAIISTPTGTISLETGGPAVARVGDPVQDGSGNIIGTIKSGSAKVFAG
ncbi:MAG: hypothetical protein WA005_02095 [Candidatus Binataceae bacterium]